MQRWLPIQVIFQNNLAPESCLIFSSWLLTLLMLMWSPVDSEQEFSCLYSSAIPVIEDDISHLYSDICVVCLVLVI